MARGVQIGKAAQETGLSIDTIRFYEKEGLLREPPRTEGGFRLYSTHDINHLRFIRRAQGLGFSLAEIHELLLVKDERVDSCTQVRDLIGHKLELVRRKVDDLKRLQSELEGALAKCHDALARDESDHISCPVLKHIADRNSFKDEAT